MEGLEYLRRLYANGLIDPQSFTQDIDQLQRLGNNPDEVILGSCPSSWPGVFMAIENLNKGARWSRYAAWGPFVGGPAAVITNACKNPELAVRWIDSMYWQEATLRSERGVLGMDWQWAKKGEKDLTGEQAVWKITHSLTGEPTSHAWQGSGPKLIWYSLWNSQVVARKHLEIEYFLYNATKENHEPYKQPREMAIPPLAFTTDQANAIADPETNITQYVNRMLTEFVRGDTDLSSGWDEYVSTLEQMGLANYVRVYQQAYGG